MTILRFRMGAGGVGGVGASPGLPPPPPVAGRLARRKSSIRSMARSILLLGFALRLRDMREAFLPAHLFAQRFQRPDAGGSQADVGMTAVNSLSSLADERIDLANDARSGARTAEAS